MHVAIVGAGPAGAWAAYSLARRGARVTLLDPSHPREKPCGGGVTGRALALAGSARFVDAAGGRSAAVRLATPAALVVASRADFDGLLLAAARDAGAKVLAARVTDVAYEHDSVRLETTAGSLRAAHVIGADGANSLIRQRFAAPFRRDQLSIATGYFAHGVTSDEIVIELVPDPAGYIWSFPRPSHLAIGICAQADTATAAALRAKVLTWIRERGIAAGARLEPYSWPIPSLGAADFERLTISGRGWSLAGDAA